LAEDDLVNRAVAVTRLEQAGIECIEVMDGREALEALDLADEGYFDAVLMDIWMPEVDGIEATRRLRARGMTLPVVATTAVADLQTREACLDAGMDEIVDKPIKFDQLFAVLARLGLLHPSPERYCAQPQDATLQAALSAIPGLNACGTLDRLGCSIFAYQDLLATFMRFNGAAPYILQDLVQSGELAPARERVHQLRGAASTIGADALASLCGKLEQGLKQRELAQTVQLLPRLTEQMKMLSNALDDIFDKYAGHTETENVVAKLADHRADP
jgi:CheY-like chemotaxis protein